jgi:hypothetical protein
METISATVAQIETLRRDALTLCAAVHLHQRDAAPVMHGALHRMESVLQDFTLGIDNATAGRQC